MRIRTCLLLLILMISACQQESTDTERYVVSDLLGVQDNEGYSRAVDVRAFSFPRDHGAHPDFRSEWWYLTGNLKDEAGKDFGFQVTLFRNAVRPDIESSASSWRTRQVWMVHAALTDLAAGTHQSHERFVRQGAGLAGVTQSPVRVWVEDMQLSIQDDGQMSVLVPADAFRLELDLVPLTPLVLQGDRGLSQKSPQPGNASYYYSLPRLQATGRIIHNNEVHKVTGLAWLDREWSTSALGPEQAGWDWFALQFADGRNLMYYQLRRKDGGIDASSSGSISDATGKIRTLSADEVSLQPLRYWSAGDRRYPVEWRMKIRGEPATWHIRTLLDEQEMRHSVRYWEGAVEVVEDGNSRPLGRGYLEMTGYR